MSTVAPHPLPLGWEAVRPLASGTTAIVTEVVRTCDGVRGALKVLHAASTPAQRARFIRGIGLLATLEHPRIPALIEHGADAGGTPWAVEALVVGTPLADALAAGRAVDAAAMVEQIGDALAHVHRAGIVHRDVSPRNVVLGDDGAHLVDLGLARDGDEGDVTTTGALLGTAGYAAPEQLREPATVTAQADVYGLAACAFTAVSGVAPHPGSTPAEIISRRLLGDRLQLAAATDAAAPAARLIEAALADDPSARPAHIGTWSEALADALDALMRRDPRPLAHHFTTTSTARTIDLHPGQAPRGSRRRVGAVAALLLLAASATIAGLLTGAPPPSERAADAGPTLRTPGARLSLPAGWVGIGAASDAPRAADRRTGATVALGGADDEGPPAWARQRGAPVALDAGPGLLWLRGGSATVAVITTRGARTVRCRAAASEVRKLCTGFAARMRGPSGRRTAVAPEEAAAVLRPALGPLRTARTVVADASAGPALRAIGLRDGDAAVRLRRAAAAIRWAELRGVRSVVRALRARAAAAAGLRASITPARVAGLRRADAELRRRVARLRLLVALPPVGAVRIRVPAKVSPGTAAGGGAVPAPQPTAQPLPPQRGQRAQPTPAPTAAPPTGTATEEEPIVVGPAL